MIRYAETYEIVTPESAEHGDVEERGFISEDCETDFRDAVDLLAGTEPSQSPIPDNATGVWFTCFDVDVNPYTGARESRSYHPKTDRDARYMIRAWRAGNAA